jgi:chromosome segregation ATPase
MDGEMSDFETVRDFMADHLNSRSARFRDAVAALDRIEAEVGRLTAEDRRLRQGWDWATARYKTAEAEVKQLRAIIEANDNYDQDATEAEVKRLQKENDDMRSQVGPVATRNRELLNEVERLKALAKSYRKDWVTAEAKVERLRKRLEIGQNLAGDLSRENERLAAENMGLREDLEGEANLKVERDNIAALNEANKIDAREAHEENEQLRTDFKRAQTEILRLEDEIERLNAENRQLRRRV